MKTWYYDIADLRTRHKSVILRLDNASEYESEEMMQFLESRGICSHYSTLKEQWQNGAAELAINSITMIARTVMAESDLGERFWFKAAPNVTFEERIGMTLHQAMYFW
jgi:hypothetical protein